MIKRLSDEYVAAWLETATMFAYKAMDLLYFVTLVSYDIENEMIFVVYDLPRNDFDLHKTIYTLERYMLYGAGLQFDVRLFNANDYEPNNDDILFHVAPNSKILYARIS